MECSTQAFSSLEFTSSAGLVPSVSNTAKKDKNSIQNSESDQDCHLTCFTNPLAEDLEEGTDLEVTGLNPATFATAEAGGLIPFKIFVQVGWHETTFASKVRSFLKHSYALLIHITQNQQLIRVINSQ